MSITPFGYVFFGSIAVGIGLTYLVTRRLRMEKGTGGIGSALYIGAVLVCLSLLFFPFVSILATSIHSMVTFPKYDAEIISFESYWDEQTYTDSDGDSYTRDVLMHRPTLRFRDDADKMITIESNTSSGSRPVIGSFVKVAYSNGTLQVISIASILLYFGLAVMLSILGYLLLYALFYGAGLPRAALNRAGAFGLFHLLIPGGMLFMLLGMVYGIYDFFLGRGDMPVWAVIICFFFSIVLALALFGYTRILLAPKQKT